MKRLLLAINNDHFDQLFVS